MVRAPALTPDARRAALVEVTLPLLRVHGRAVTTRQIAEAAGVAEGTIFRVFDSKDDLIEQALRDAFDPWPLVATVRGIDRSTDLRTRLTELVTVVQDRFLEIFDLMSAVGMIHPPDEHHAKTADWRAAMTAAMTEVVGADAELLRTEVAHALHVIRLLTFAGSHPGIADGHLLTPDVIVDVLLHGLLRKDR